jgi:hypothetical protein
MLSSFSSAVQSALAPDVPPVVDFRHQWNLFLRHYAENKPLGHKSRPVEGTNLVFHLNNMLKLLVQEQSVGGGDRDGCLGPCMEYLINHQILDILSSLCQADTPPGIRPYIYNVFVFIVTRIRSSQSILPYVNVYLPVRRLLMLSCVGKASPTEGQELQFVTALVARLRSDPDLLPLFAHDSRPGDSSHCSSRRSSSASTAAAAVDMARIRRMLLEGEISSGREDLFELYESQHLVVASLVNFFDSADYMVAFRAMESLLVVCQLDEKSSAQNAVEGTPLCRALTDRLASIFNAVPRDVSASSVEEIRVNWMEEAHHLQKTASSDATDFKGRAELVAFFSWLDYCDTLVKESVDTISRAVAAAVGEDFFVGCLERRLCAGVECEDANETVLVLAYISQCWVHIRSTGLASEFSAWLLGCADEPELKGVTTHPLKHTLLQLCLSDDQDVAIEALRLFDVVLERPCDSMLQNIALSNLIGRGYYDGGLAESQIASWSDEEDERERQKSSERRIMDEQPTSEVIPTVNSRTLAPSNIARVVNKWLFLLPDEWRSSDSARDSGYEQYVRNAEVQAAAVFRMCRGFIEWPREAVFSCEGGERDSSDSRAEADGNASGKTFYEGEFLGVLFDMLETLLERDYDVNLQVRIIIICIQFETLPLVQEKDVFITAKTLLYFR